MNKSNAPLTRILLVVFFLLVMALTVFGFSRPWLPTVATRHGEGVDVVINYLFVTTGIIFVVGHLGLAWLVWRFSSGRPATYQPISSRAEWLWVAAPVILMAAISEAGVLVMGGSVFQQLYGDPPEGALEVEVVGKQFEWFVRYPGKDGRFGATQPELVHEVRNPLGLDKQDRAAKDDLFSRGVLRLPVGRPVVISLRSLDVQHSFTVPTFRVKQDLVPGFVTRAQFEPTHTGEYEIACAELCGLGHYKMRGVVLVLTQAEFDEWVDAQFGWFE